MEPGREAEYQRRIAALEATVADLKATIAKLLARNSELEAENARLKKNSSNSSKPPSSDIVKPPKQPVPGGGKRKIGGQPGHPKHQRAPFPPEQISEIIRIEKPDPGDLIPLDEWISCQQVDLVEQPLLVREYRARLYRDPRTGLVVQAAFPVELQAAGLVGPRLSTLLAYLKSVGHASFSTLRKFCRDVFKLPISRGQLVKVVQKVSQAIAPAYLELEACLPQQERLNVDETGHKDNGKSYWTWCLRAELFTLFHIDSSRGSDVLVELLGRDFNGALGCDYFSAYRKFMNLSDVRVQFCMAHLIRDVKFLLTLPDAASQNYGRRLLATLKNLFRIIHRRETMTPEDFQRALERAREQILAVGLRAPLRTEAQNMADRFRKHGDAYFRFLTTPGLEPTNNLAEQAIRFVVIDRYVTQGTRSRKGRDFCQRVWTAIATCTQQGRSVFEFLHQSFHAWLQGTPAPSLLPAGP